MRIILMGGPGAGKGTQAAFVCARFGIPQISTGDILRRRAGEGSAVGARLKAVMDAGELVSDVIINELVRTRLDESDCRAGFLLDGFPRTIPQARALQLGGVRIDCVVHIAVDDEQVVQRLSGRRVHLASGRSYHVSFNPPRISDRDDVTGEPLIQRDDDREGTVRERLAVFHAQTVPLVQFYCNDMSRDRPGAPRYRRLEGVGSVEATRLRIAAILDDVMCRA